MEIQQAIDALSDSGGKVLLLEGQFNISASIQPSKTFLLLEGLGKSLYSAGTVVKLANDANANLIESPDDTYRELSLCSFSLDGNKDNNVSGHGIRLDYLTLELFDVCIRNCAEDGIHGDLGIANCIHASHFYLLDNDGNGLAAYLQGAIVELPNWIHANGIWGFYAKGGTDSIYELELESNQEGGCNLAPLQNSDVVVWTKNNWNRGFYASGKDNRIVVHASKNGQKPGGSAMPYEVHLADLYESDIHIVVTDAEQAVADVNGLYLDGTNGKGNRISGSIHTTGYAIRFGTSLAADGTIISDMVLDGVSGWLYPGAIPAGIKIYEQYCNHFQDCLAASTNYVHAGIVGTGAEQEITTAITNPDVPRNISITTTNVSSPSGDVTITGVDAKGNSITEDITIVAGSTAYGNKAFSTVSKITIPAGVTSDDTVAVGMSDKLGLSNVIYETGDVYKAKKNNADITVGTVNVTNGTVDCATITGGDDFTIYYRSNLNIIE